MADVREDSPGRVLAAARQARGMTVTEVALRLKFAPRQIEALEADRYEQLPPPTIARGMIRGYAKLLAIAPEPLRDLPIRIPGHVWLPGCHANADVAGALGRNRACSEASPPRR